MEKNVICNKPLQIKLKLYIILFENRIEPKIPTPKLDKCKKNKTKMFPPFVKESTSSWLDSVIVHLADIIVLEDTPSIQMEVGVLVKEFPDIR